MQDELFSKREGYEEPIVLLPHDELPTAAKNDFIDEFEYRMKRLNIKHYEERSIIVDRIYHELRPIIWEVDGSEPRPFSFGGEQGHIKNTIMRCSWNRFYDICEVIFSYLKNNISTHHFIQVVNSRFRHHGIAWKYNNEGKIVRVRPEHVEEAIKDAWALLSSDSRFTAASNQFAKAISLTEQRPTPDYANAVKDAVGTVESVMNVVGKTTATTLSELTNRPPFREAIDPIIRNIIEKIYAYRGNAEAVAHGATGNPPVDEDEAYLMITLSSGTIAYLIAKFPGK